jgi:anti-anti-sigma factor
VAEVDGTIRAARSLRTGETIADPFTHTAHLCDVLAARAAQFEVRPQRRLALRWVRRPARTEPAPPAPRVGEEGVLIVRVEQDGDALVVRASGEVNLTNAKTLEAELRRAIDGGASAVVLDLDGVGFIDTVGLRVLLLIAKQARRNGVLLSRLRGSPSVERLIEKSGVEGLLAFVD